MHYSVLGDPPRIEPSFEVVEWLVEHDVDTNVKDEVRLLSGNDFICLFACSDFTIEGKYSTALCIPSWQCKYCQSSGYQRSKLFGEE